MLAVYPGSFDPPTIAHLAIAEAAARHPEVSEVRLVLSVETLGKTGHHASLAARAAVVAEMVATRPRLGCGQTSARLIVDIAEEAGAGAVVVGADKWAQIVDPAWYGGSTRRRDDVLRRLPLVLLARRAGAPPLPPPAGLGAEIHPLAIGAHLGEVSATRVRGGERELMVPEAQRAGHWG